MKIILQPEISIDTDQLVKQLREQAHSACCGGSDAVDRLEYKAAAVIEALARRLAKYPDWFRDETI